MPSKNKKHKVLNDGFVELVDFMGGDLQVVNSARISYSNRHSTMEVGDGKLINFLLKHRHGTPFESSVFTFHVRAPIFVVREWQRHRIASYNELSGRYTEMKESFYIPEPEDVREQIGKAGNYSFASVPTRIAEQLISELRQAYQQTYNLYKSWLQNGIAKEVARIILPLSLYTEFYFTVNARSLMNFLALRNDERALREIREYAIILEKVFEEKMPCTYEAFIMNDRRNP